MLSNFCHRRLIEKCCSISLVLGLWLGFNTIQGGELCLSMGIFQESPSSTKIGDSITRTWASADGRFKQSGKLLEHLGESVRIEAEDSKTLVVAIKKLCDEDQQFIQQELARMSEEANPFVVENKSTTKMKPNPTSSDNTEAASTVIENYVPVFINVPNISLESANAIDLQSPHWASAKRQTIKPFRVPAFSIHTRITGHSANVSESFFAVSMFEPFGVDLAGTPHSVKDRRSKSSSAISTKSWVEMVALPSGKSNGRFPLPADHTVVADVDSSGERILAFDGVFSSEPKIYIFRIENQQLVTETRWNSTHQNGRQEKAESARFLDDNHVIVQYGAHLQVWQLNPLEPKFTVNNDIADWQLASDRRHAIVGQANQRFEVDLLAGECKGKSGETISAAKGTPSPDGSIFAKLTRSVLTLTDAQGKVTSSFYAPVFWPEPTLAWIDENTLRVDSPNQSHYFDLPRRALFLEIVNAAQPSRDSGWQVEKTEQDRTYFVDVSQNQGTGQQAVELDVYRGKLPNDANSLEILKSGDRVRLTMNLEATPEKAATVRQQLVQLLKAKGVVVDKSATDELRASSEARDEEVEYRRFGVPPWAANGVEKVKIRRIDQRLELIRDTEVVFRHSTTSGPGFMLNIRDGETAQQAADRQAGDPVDFWKNLELPQTISQHPKGQAWTRLIKQDNKFVELKD